MYEMPKRNARIQSSISEQLSHAVYQPELQELLNIKERTHMSIMMQEKAARKEAERQYKLEQEARKRAKLAAKAQGGGAARM